jgi:hypothetical protein
MLAQDSAVLRAVSGGSGSGISEVNLSWYIERPTESVSDLYAIRCAVVMNFYLCNNIAGECDGRLFPLHTAMSGALFTSPQGPIPALQCLRHPAQPCLAADGRSAAVHCGAPGARAMSDVCAGGKGEKPGVAGGAQSRSTNVQSKVGLLCSDGVFQVLPLIRCCCRDGSPAVSADAAAGLCGGEGEKKPSIEWAFVSEVVATLVQVVSMALR